jgi:hypothetical protein
MSLSQDVASGALQFIGWELTAAVWAVGAVVLARFWSIQVVRAIAISVPISLTLFTVLAWIYATWFNPPLKIASVEIEVSGCGARKGVGSEAAICDINYNKPEGMSDSPTILSATLGPVLPGSGGFTCCSYAVSDVTATHARVWAYNYGRDVPGIFSSPWPPVMKVKLAIVYKN